MYPQKIFYNINDVNFAFLQIRSGSIGAGLPREAALMFNRHIRALLYQINKELINLNSVNENCEALKLQQDKYLRDNDTPKDSLSFPARSSIAL